MQRPQRRRFGAQFTLGAPVPVTRLQARGLVLGADISLPCGQTGRLCALPPRGGLFTRLAVRASALTHKRLARKAAEGATTDDVS